MGGLEVSPLCHRMTSVESNQPPAIPSLQWHLGVHAQKSWFLWLLVVHSGFGPRIGGLGWERDPRSISPNQNRIPMHSSHTTTQLGMTCHLSIFFGGDWYDGKSDVECCGSWLWSTGKIFSYNKPIHLKRNPNSNNILVLAAYAPWKHVKAWSNTDKYRKLLRATIQLFPGARLQNNESCGDAEIELFPGTHAHTTFDELIRLNPSACK